MSGVAAPDPKLVAFLEASGLARPGERVRWVALAGGVSSDIWRADIDGRSICVKRALPKLKVAQEWHAPVARNAYEWEWLRFAAAVAPDAVPQPLAHDSDLGAFAMAFLDAERYPVWKRQLLRGQAAVAFAARVGEVLGTLHAASAGDATVARTFATDAIFHAIRLEPYLLATARRHPDLSDALVALEQRTAAHKLALVHGDVSPKNILAGPAGPVFLDAECAWYGDPAFDLAFCLNHLLLKCVVRPEATDGYLSCYAALATTYLDRVRWEMPRALEQRAATLLAGLLLARIDGKSPVEYITRDDDRELVRRHARALLSAGTDNLGDIAQRWRGAMLR